MKKTIIAFDVNGTLTQPPVRELFKLLDREKCFVVVWSTLGKTYAHEFCTKYNLNPDDIWDKHSQVVDIAIDDIPETIRTAKMVVKVS